MIYLQVTAAQGERWDDTLKKYIDKYPKIIHRIVNARIRMEAKGHCALIELKSKSHLDLFAMTWIGRKIEVIPNEFVNVQEDITMCYYCDEPE